MIDMNDYSFVTVDENYRYTNYYNNLSERQKLNVRNRNYLHIITDFLTEMFEIKGLSNEYKQRLIKTIIFNGTALIEKHDTDKYIIAPCYYTGIPKPWECYPTEITASYNTWTYSGSIKDNQTVAYLTPDRTALSIINRFTTQLAQVDTSLVNNVLFCRISPIISACTSNSKKMYEDTIDRMMLGEVKNVITDVVNPLTNNTAPLTVTDISKADYAEKIQYLSMLHQDLLSRLCMLFGIDYKHHDKQANLLQDEMKNGDDYLKVYPRMMLKCLNEGLEKIGLKANFASVWEKLNISDTENSEASDTENKEVSDTENKEVSDTENKEVSDTENKE